MVAGDAVVMAKLKFQGLWCCRPLTLGRAPPVARAGGGVRDPIPFCPLLLIPVSVGLAAGLPAAL